MQPAEHTQYVKPLQELERLPLPERQTLITLGNSILAESVALQAPPAQAFRQSLAEQLSEMKGIHKICWTLGSAFLTAGLLFYTDGTASLPAITDWSVAVLLGLTTVGLSAAELRIQRNMKTYQRIDKLHTRYGHSLFCDMLHTARKRFHLHRGKALSDVLAAAPSYLPPARRFSAIARSLLDEASAQAALHSEATPSAIFQKNAQRHARTLRLVTAVSTLSLAGLAVGFAKDNKTEGYAVSVAISLAAARALQSGRHASFLFSYAAKLEAQHGPSTFGQLLDLIDKKSPPIAPKHLR